jgi:hypothetical protein
MKPVDIEMQFAPRGGVICVAEDSSVANNCLKLRKIARRFE